MILCLKMFVDIPFEPVMLFHKPLDSLFFKGPIPAFTLLEYIATKARERTVSTRLLLVAGGKNQNSSS